VQELTPEIQIIHDIASFAHDPERFSLYAYPWGTGELVGAGCDAPRTWQRQIFTDIKTHLTNPNTRFQPLKIAIASGHGIGKSACISQIIDWAMSTCTNCRVVITANTETQLRTKTWPEVRKWLKLSINADWWDVTATKISAKHDPENWRTDAVTWSAHNTEAFAGLHNVRRRIVVIFDEASGIDAKVWEVTLGALTDENTEIIWIAFGNPTQNSGSFYGCFNGKQANQWIHRQIDSRTVEGTNKAELQKMVDAYGEDSDLVKVRVRGMFPAMSMKSFISANDVDAAFGKHLREDMFSFAPKIISVDPAWSGDDKFVIGMRQGLAFKILAEFPKNDNDVQMANIIARYEQDEKADAVFIDGGYGTGIVSVGRSLGKDWQLVWFGGGVFDQGYLNKRAEMWGAMKQWLKEGGAIPEDHELYTELISYETVGRTDGKIQMEGKEDMKKRLQQGSPNKADALAITFAFPVSKKHTGYGNNQTGFVTDYKPDY